jgi:hypothetical protein
VDHLRTIARKDTVSVRVFSIADPALELWAARHKTDLFELAYNREVKFTNRMLKKHRTGRTAAVGR